MMYWQLLILVLVSVSEIAKTNICNLSVGTHLKLIINFNSLDIHLVSKITPYIHKMKDAPELSATNGRSMKPKTPGRLLHGHLSDTTSDNTV
jgi:hypothetical protein